MWNIYSNPYPPLGIEVIAYNPAWIDEDYNPDGTRIGFQNLSCDEQGEFISAEYCNHCDEYMTRDSSDPPPGSSISQMFPTHWIHKPSFLKKEVDNG